jgi:hypothetical protein
MNDFLQHPHSFARIGDPMQMIYSRKIAFIDVQSLAPCQAREALFRDENNGFILYLSDGVNSANMEERVIRLETREALIWLNETSDDGGAFWS